MMKEVFMEEMRCEMGAKEVNRIGTDCKKRMGILGKRKKVNKRMKSQKEKAC